MIKAWKSCSLNSFHSYTYQCISALRFLYSHLLHDGDKMRELPRPKKEKTLPTVLRRDKVYRFIHSLRNPKHRLIMALVYSAGLRLGEIETICHCSSAGHVAIFRTASGKTLTRKNGSKNFWKDKTSFRDKRRCFCPLPEALLCYSFTGIGNWFTIYPGTSWAQRSQDHSNIHPCFYNMSFG